MNWINNKDNPLYPLSDHYDGKHFYNPNGIRISQSLSQMWSFTLAWIKRARSAPIKKHAAQPIFADGISMQECYITFVNHACHLIQCKELNVLTDPIFSKRASPLPLLGPKRLAEPGITFEELPKIHVVVISHNHYDHMDLPTLKKLDKKYQPIFLVPLGNKKYLRSLHNVIELDWWQSYAVNSQQIITLVPAQHWSMRLPGDAYKALWGGYWIQSGELKIFFAGDTGYSEHFKTIQQTLGTPTISILPIGAYEPRWFMKNQHMNPEEAVIASLDLKSKFNIATHFHTFRLSTERMEDPAINLHENMQRYGLNDTEFLAPENGETVIYNKS